MDLRKARRRCPQLVCVLADTSRSMAAGNKIQSATEGIRGMIMHCQASGPYGPESFQLLLITFNEVAAIHPLGTAKLVGDIDPDNIQLDGHGKRTNISAALALLLAQLQPYMAALQSRPKEERDECPLPLVILFTDGEHNCGDPPKPIADQIKNLALDDDPVIICAAAIGVRDKQYEETLRGIATPECYFNISHLNQLKAFIASVGSSGSSRLHDVVKLCKKAVTLIGDY